MELMGNMEFFTRRLTCTDEEKRACLETVRQMTRARFLVRRHGILALEKLEEGEISPFLRDCLALVMDGCESDELEGLFTRMLLAEDCSGKEFFCRALIADGLLEACRCEGGDTLANTLAAWFGAGWSKTVVDTVRREWDRLSGPPEARQVSAYPGFDRLLELSPGKRDELMASLAGTDFDSCRLLVLALQDAGEAVKGYLLDGLSPEKRKLNEQAISGAWISWPEEREAAQRQIVEMAFGRRERANDP